MESTAVNKSNSILQKHNHYQAPVRMDEDVELEVKINCAGNEARHAASVSEWRASSGAIEPARTAVCMEGREGPESDLHLIHKKKRDWSGSPPPSLPPDKRKDSHLLEQRLPILSSAKTMCGPTLHSPNPQFLIAKHNLSFHQPTILCPLTSQSCEVCGEQFDMAWDDEREQWSLKNAIRFDIKTYHPSCYEDFTKVCMDFAYCV
ncbi:hypothetical protein JZ751_002150 [Albula glossodonta]|uniref:Pcf11 C-terminal domain-containing protein n=1 Tax=Albula glossodonta TaxID=121402 RepID=A0A8T2P789_9TELE|nr:hypothetical protein JZ751_002150 [Albula glossodonta]